MYLNRVQYDAKVSDMRKKEASSRPEHDFKPKITANSEHIAKKYREKLEQQV